MNDLSDGDWEEAQRLRDLIASLLDGTRCPRAIIVERARAGDCATTTLYRWAVSRVGPSLVAAPGEIERRLRKEPPQPCR
jgi:hypothetical protein